MQLQIKSIEYKLTPENVGQLFLEHEKLSGIGFDKKRWMAPTIAGLAVAGLLFWLNYPLKGTLMINQFNLSSILNIFSLVFVLAMGFCSGFGGVLLLRKLLLETVLQKALRSKNIKDLESVRKISWDSTALAIASPPSWAGKIKWSEIESIKQGEFGIHIYKNGRVFYSVPKNALPMDLPADELVRSWSLFMAQSKATTQI